MYFEMLCSNYKNIIFINKFSFILVMYIVFILDFHLFDSSFPYICICIYTYIFFYQSLATFDLL